MGADNCVCVCETVCVQGRDLCAVVWVCVCFAFMMSDDMYICSDLCLQGAVIESIGELIQEIEGR